MTDQAQTYTFEVEEYISQQEEPYQEWLRDLRVIIHEAVPQITERIERGLPVFNYKVEDLCYIAAGTEQITLGFYQGSALKDPFNNLEGTGEDMRFMLIEKEADIRDQTISKWLDQLTDRIDHD